jgi:hypothetical protein
MIENVNSSHNLDDKFNYFHNTFIQNSELSFLFKIQKICEVRKQWLTNGIRVSYKHKGGNSTPVPGIAMALN